MSNHAVVRPSSFFGLARVHFLLTFSIDKYILLIHSFFVDYWVLSSYRRHLAGAFAFCGPDLDPNSFLSNTYEITRNLHNFGAILPIQVI